MSFKKAANAARITNRLKKSGKNFTFAVSAAGDEVDVRIGLKRQIRDLQRALHDANSETDTSRQKLEQTKQLLVNERKDRFKVEGKILKLESELATAKDGMEVI